MEFSQCPCDVAVNRLKRVSKLKLVESISCPLYVSSFLTPMSSYPPTHTHTHTHTHTQMQLPTFCDKTPSSPCLLQVTKAFTF